MKHCSEYAFETAIATLLDNGRYLQKEASGGDRQGRPKGEPQNEPV
jgi:riboflavin synthase